MKNELDSSDAENKVCRLLQCEADAEIPVFSPELHARIMQAVSRRKAPDLRATGTPNGNAVKYFENGKSRQNGVAEVARLGGAARNTQILANVGYGNASQRCLNGSTKSRRTVWEPRIRWVATLTAVALIAIFFPWRPGTVHLGSPAGPQTPSSAMISDPAEGLELDSLELAFDQLAVAAAVAGNHVAQTVADQTVVDRHLEFWDQNAQAIGDALLDPLPISWQPADSEQAAPTNENS